MVQGLARRRINPNLLTVTGVLINVLCGLMFALGHFFWAGVVLIGALSTHPTSNSIFANGMPAVLWILAVGSFWTFAYRVYHTWSELNRIGADATARDLSETSQTQAAATRRADAHGAPAPSGDASNTDTGRPGAPDIARRVPASR